MTHAAEDAVADFFRKGGKIVKAPETIAVTQSEVLDYLVGRGFRVRHSSGYSSAYAYEGKLVSLNKLIELANDHRRSQKLPPFAVRVNISIGGKRPLPPA